VQKSFMQGGMANPGSLQQGDRMVIRCRAVQRRTTPLVIDALPAGFGSRPC
jgi:uncharacterized protein YfaS (alpha-2-macroglobulin family)